MRFAIGPLEEGRAELAGADAPEAEVLIEMEEEESAAARPLKRMNDPKEASAEQRVKPRALTIAVPHVVYSLREGQRESSGRPKRIVPKHQAAPTAWRSKSSRASKVCCAS